MAHVTSKLVSSFRKSGLSAREYSEKHGVALSTLHYHLQKSRESGRFSKQPEPSFVPVQLNEPADGDTTIVFVRGRFSHSQIVALVQGISG